MEKFGKKEALLVYLPEERDMDKVPRQWLVDVIYTVFDEDFKTWVHDLVEARNEHAKGEEEDQIVMDPEIYAIFERSTLVSRKFLSPD